MKKSHRVLALAGIILLIAMYASTLIFALMDSPSAKGLFMASIFCTFAVPILLFAMIQTARALRGRGAEDETKALPQDMKTVETGTRSDSCLRTGGGPGEQ